MQCYGAMKVWKQLRREVIEAARCTGERLIRQAGLKGIRRGQVVCTTVAGDKALCSLDRVQRQFHADRPNQLWVADSTYVSTWQGWLYVAFVIDVFARRIVGWRVSTSMKTDFVLDALEQALYARQPHRMGGLIHRSDGVASTYQSATPSGWQRPVSSPRWVARATAMTTPWLKPSTGCTKPS